ncbi:hypothetical protein ACELLULO517_02055 [Acidisoma cellulosilytica]|uniref:Uncharacterized protein n=1 Tax=Acidisoma cellulosilyticum TaxID=2802395 RepID=A0A964E237_9PROT|nr:hypothetical protein [Acidisoma cellulosilyticum]MCB8879001.1 hypothetical protein [Acidisoma cellulosilyticum]
MDNPVMQPSRILLLAGVVMAGAISLAGLAYAGDSGFKTLRLQLPGGQIAQIELSDSAQQQTEPAPGAVMPVAYSTDAMASPAGNPFAPSSAQTDPFARLDRISAMLDQRQAAMMQAMQIMTGPHLPGMHTLMPAGSNGVSYTFISIANGVGGGCMQSIQITSAGQGLAPHVVRTSAGSCGGPQHGTVAGTPAVSRITRPPALPAPELIRARDVRPIAVPQASQT